MSERYRLETVFGILFCAFCCDLYGEFDFVTLGSQCPSLIKVLKGMGHRDRDFFFLSGIMLKKGLIFLTKITGLGDQWSGEFYLSTGHFNSHGPPDQWEF